MNKGKDDSRVDKRKKVRRGNDRCPGCVIDTVGTMEEKMEKMAKAINRLIGAHGVILVIFCASFFFMLKFSMTAQEATERVEGKFDKVAIKTVKLETTQGFVLEKIAGLSEINTGMSKYVKQMADDNKAQTELLIELVRK